MGPILEDDDEALTPLVSQMTELEHFGIEYSPEGGLNLGLYDMMKHLVRPKLDTIRNFTFYWKFELYSTGACKIFLKPYSSFYVAKSGEMTALKVTVNGKTSVDLIKADPPYTVEGE